MLALADLQSDRCRCGGWLSETTDPDGDHHYEIKKRYCFRCREVELYMIKQAKLDEPLHDTQFNQTAGRMVYAIPASDNGEGETGSEG